MERTLYLNENRWLSVRRDGPSLRIEERYKAGRRVPVRLIGQVVIRGNITLESSVITLLAENGVPISFLSRKGDVVATTMALNSTHTIVRERVEELSQSICGQSRVKQWLTARRLNLQRALLKDLLLGKVRFIDKNGLREKDYQRFLEHLLSQVTEKGQLSAVSSIIHGLFHELVLKKVLEVELDPHRGFHHCYQNFAFVKDLCYALEAERDRQLIQFFDSPLRDQYLKNELGHWMVNSGGMRNLVVRFENHKKKILGHIDILLQDFFDLLREVWV